MSEPTIDELLAQAQQAVYSAQAQFAMVVQRIGMTRAYTGEDSPHNFQLAVEAYVKATARHEMLKILSTEDFFVAMSRSAGSMP